MLFSFLGIRLAIRPDERDGGVGPAGDGVVLFRILSEDRLPETKNYHKKNTCSRTRRRVKYTE